MFIKIILGLIVILGLWLGVLVYYSNKKSKDNKLFLIQIIFVVFWIVFNYMENDPLPFETRKLFLYIDFIIAITWGFFWYLFCYNFLEDKKIFTKKNIFFLFLSFLMPLFVINNYVIYDFEIVDNIIIFKNGPLFAVYALLALYYYIGGSVILYFKYKKFLGKKKIQALYVLLGFLLTGAIVSITNLFFQEDLPVEIFRLVNISFVFLIGFSGYAIVRHNLFDIRIIIQRGIIYSLIFALIISFYLSAIFIMGYLFQGEGRPAIYMFSLFTTILGIYGVPIIEKKFRKVTDHIFFKDKYDYSEAVYSLSEILNKNIELEKLLKEANSKLLDILKVEKLRILLIEKNIVIDETGELRKPLVNLAKSQIKEIENSELPILSLDQIPYLKKSIKNNSDQDKLKVFLDIIEKFGKKEKITIFSSIKLENKLIGILFLGKKKSGDVFSGDDINLVKTFSSQAATALIKAQLYRKVKEYSRDLEKKVLQRTAKITGLQELQKQMMIEMSHGLQTPLTIIRGELEFIRDGEEDKEGLARMEKSVEKLSKFIYNMLSLAKLENVNNDIKKIDLNLSEIISELIEYFEVVSEEKGIKIKYDIDNDIHIMGNKERLEEMMTNFVSNAVKYMGEGEKKELVINLKKKGKNIELVIEDTGMGMNKEDLNNIFKRFYRSNDEAHSRIRGTGLGLAICKQIIKMHNGKVRAESKVGKGTKFTIIFFKK